MKDPNVRLPPTDFQCKLLPPPNIPQSYLRLRAILSVPAISVLPAILLTPYLSQHSHKPEQRRSEEHD